VGNVIGVVPEQSNRLQKLTSSLGRAQGGGIESACGGVLATRMPSAAKFQCSSTEWLSR